MGLLLMVMSSYMFGGFKQKKRTAILYRLHRLY